ncbi:hypothetical protein [Fodinicola feengrottensis]|uniref:hypothetical protein n=1 Tax=Fodinicola feengrottensis TaxID=435914 RepID=UPI002442B878|nr:hypothetical protein [Fodinicola feengrottensis]
MQFGMFFELQLPRPWADGDEHRLVQNALEWVELGEEAGGSRTPGRRSTTFWRSTRIPPHPRCSCRR